MVEPGRALVFSLETCRSQGKRPLRVRAHASSQRRRQQVQRRHHDWTQPQDRAFTDSLVEVSASDAKFIDISCSCPFPRDSVFALARGTVASGAMKERLLSRFHVRLFAVPNLQSRLLDGAGKRKRQ